MSTAKESSPQLIFEPLVEDGQNELDRSRCDLAFLGLIERPSIVGIKKGPCLGDTALESRRGPRRVAAPEIPRL